MSQKCLGLSICLFIFIFGPILSADEQPKDTQELTVYVSPHGDDRQNGTLERPFKTITKAQQQVRFLIKEHPDRNITVFFRAGRYELERGLVFNPMDGGRENTQITYQAYPGETVTFSGGRQISHWKKVSANLWETNIPEVLNGPWFFRQLFGDNQRLTRARWPNANEPMLTMTDFEEIKEGDFVVRHKLKFDQALPFSDLAGQESELVLLHVWSCSRQRIAESDSDFVKTQYGAGWIGHSYTSPDKTRDPAFRRAWLEHAKAFMDVPGEWYLDRDTGILSYLAYEKENPPDTVFTAPRIEQLLRIQGTDNEPVKNLHFKGIRFHHAEWQMPIQGYNGIQATCNGTRYMLEPTYMLPAAIHMKYADHCSFTQCEFAHLGAGGLALAAGCDNTQVIGCSFFDIGGNAITAGWREKADVPPRQWFENDRDNPDAVPKKNQFMHNHIYNCGVVQLGAVGYMEAFVEDTLFAHNDIHDMPYSGISIGFAWNDLLTSQKRCTVEYNKIQNVMQLLYDGGGIYTLGYQPGTVIRNNYIEDVPGGHGIYTDEGSSHILFENNIVNRAGVYGYQHHYGHHNIFRNNIICSPGKYAIMRCRNDKEPSFFLERNIILLDRHDENMTINWFCGRQGDQGEAFNDNNSTVDPNNDIFVMDQNLYWDTRGKELHFAQLIFDQWKNQRGHDRQSVVADPQFKDYKNGDFSLPEDSPAIRLGFKPIDTSTIGRQEPYRRD